MLEKMYDTVLIICAFTAVFTLHLVINGSLEWYWPVIFLLLYLQPLGILAFERIRKAIDKRSKRRDGGALTSTTGASSR